MFKIWIYLQITDKKGLPWGEEIYPPPPAILYSIR